MKLCANRVFTLLFLLFGTFVYEVEASSNDSASTLSFIGYSQNDTLPTGQGVKVAVVEHLIVQQHPALVGKFIEGYNCKTGSVVPPAELSDNTTSIDTLTEFKGHIPLPSHGTHVVGTICGEGFKEKGYGGLAPDVQIIPILVPGSEEGDEVYVEQLIRGLRYVLDNHQDCRIINISQSLPQNPELDSVLEECIAGNMIIVQSFGNRARPIVNDKKSEMLQKGIVRVANLMNSKALTFEGKKLKSDQDRVRRRLYADKDSGSNFPHQTRFIGNAVALPGEDVMSAVYVPPSFYMGRRTGTSMATPLCASIVALLCQAYPGESNFEIIVNAS
ncbi:MAG: S8 family serine peptidase [bacterium]|nr:S8 family serine peptidase [bacterium]